MILNLYAVLKSSMILLGLKTLEKVVQVWIGKEEERKMVNGNGLMYRPKEFELHPI